MLRLVIGFAIVFSFAATALAHLQDSQEVATRFGVLSVNEDKVLLFKGQPISPTIEGNNSLDLGTVMRIGETDVVLVTNNGGTGCPAVFYFVTISPTGAKATPQFGTCSDLAAVKRTGTSISVTMPGFLGPFEPRTAQRKAARQRHVFTYRVGVVYENGKPVK